MICIKPSLWQIYFKRFNKDMIKIYCKKVRDEQIEKQRQIDLSMKLGILRKE